MLDRAVADGGVPGILTEIRDGRETWFGTAGVADTATGWQRRPQDRFRVGSTTKTFTATVVLQLAAEHRLSLDDSVEKWLPDVVRGPGYEPEKISIRQLLNHTSGIFDHVNDEAMSLEQARTFAPEAARGGHAGSAPAVQNAQVLRTGEADQYPVV